MPESPQGNIEREKIDDELDRHLNPASATTSSPLEILDVQKESQNDSSLAEKAGNEMEDGRFSEAFDTIVQIQDDVLRDQKLILLVELLVREGRQYELARVVAEKISHQYRKKINLEYISKHAPDVVSDGNSADTDKKENEEETVSDEDKKFAQTAEEELTKEDIIAAVDAIEKIQNDDLRDQKLVSLIEYYLGRNEDKEFNSSDYEKARRVTEFLSNPEVKAKELDYIAKMEEKDRRKEEERKTVQAAEVAGAEVQEPTVDEPAEPVTRNPIEDHTPEPSAFSESDFEKKFKKALEDSDFDVAFEMARNIKDDKVRNNYLYEIVSSLVKRKEFELANIVADAMKGGMREVNLDIIENTRKENEAAGVGAEEPTVDEPAETERPAELPVENAPGPAPESGPHVFPEDTSPKGRIEAKQRGIFSPGDLVMWDGKGETVKEDDGEWVTMESGVMVNAEELRKIFSGEKEEDFFERESVTSLDDRDMESEVVYEIQTLNSRYYLKKGEDGFLYIKKSSDVSKGDFLRIRKYPNENNAVWNDVSSRGHLEVNQVLFFETEGDRLIRTSGVIGIYKLKKKESISKTLEESDDGREEYTPAVSLEEEEKTPEEIEEEKLKKEVQETCAQYALELAKWKQEIRAKRGKFANMVYDIAGDTILDRRMPLPPRSQELVEAEKSYIEAKRKRRRKFFRKEEDNLKSELEEEMTPNPEQEKEKVTLTVGDVESIIKKQLQGRAKIKKLEIVISDDIAELVAELDAGSIGGKISLKGSICNLEDGITVKNLTIDARSFVKSRIEDSLSGLGSAMRSFFEKEKGKSVSRINIVGGNLEVEFEEVAGEKEEPKLEINPDLLAEVEEEQKLLQKKILENTPEKEKSTVMKALTMYSRLPIGARWAASAALAGSVAFIFGGIGVSGAAAYTGYRFGRAALGGVVGKGVAQTVDNIYIKKKNQENKERAFEEYLGELDEENFEESERKLMGFLEKQEDVRKKQNLAKAAIMVGTGIGTSVLSGLMHSQFSAGSSPESDHGQRVEDAPRGVGRSGGRPASVVGRAPVPESSDKPSPMADPNAPAKPPIESSEHAAKAVPTPEETAHYVTHEAVEPSPEGEVKVENPSAPVTEPVVSKPNQFGETSDESIPEVKKIHPGPIGGQPDVVKPVVSEINPSSATENLDKNLQTGTKYDTETGEKNQIETSNDIHPETASERAPVDNLAEKTTTTVSSRGFIQTFEDLKEKLRAQYPDPKTVPPELRHIYDTSPTKLAQEFGFYDPSHNASGVGYKGETIDLNVKGQIEYGKLDGQKVIVDAEHPFTSQSVGGKMSVPEREIPAEPEVTNQQGAESAAMETPVSPETEAQTPVPDELGVPRVPSVEAAEDNLGSTDTSPNATVYDLPLTSQLSSITETLPRVEVPEIFEAHGTTYHFADMPGAGKILQMEIPTAEGKTFAEIARETQYHGRSMLVLDDKFQNGEQFKLVRESYLKAQDYFLGGKPLIFGDPKVSVSIPFNFEGGRVYVVQGIGQDPKALGVFLNGKEIARGVTTEAGAAIDLNPGLKHGLFQSMTVYERAFQSIKPLIKSLRPPKV